MTKDAGRFDIAGLLNVLRLCSAAIETYKPFLTNEQKESLAYELTRLFKPKDLLRSSLTNEQRQGETDDKAN